LHKNDLSLFSPAKVVRAIVISKQKQGFMEAVFLDSEHHKYLQEGSSCNIFLLLKK